MNHLTIEELDYRLEEIIQFEKECFNQLDNIQKKQYEKNQYRCNVFVETIQLQKNKQKINKENCVSHIQIGLCNHRIRLGLTESKKIECNNIVILVE
jgi:hypothetical protein